jgi:DHA2 family multidrug resistance protein-like MFS transporter
MTALGIAGYLLLRDGSVLAQVLVLTVCGIGIGASLTASSTLVMSNVSEDRAGMAGSVEGVAYEFGGGFGVTIFGSLMTAVYVSTVDRLGFALQAGGSLDEAHAHARAHPEAQAMLQAAMQAFETSFTWVSVAVAAILLALVLAVLGQRRRLGAAGEAPRVVAY